MVRACTVQSLPYAQMEGPGMRALLTGADKRFQDPPKRRGLDKRTWAIYTEVKKQCIEEVQGMWESLPSCTSDIWSSTAKDAYISLTFHWINSTFEMKSRSLGALHFPGELWMNSLMNGFKVNCCLSIFKSYQYLLATGLFLSYIVMSIFCLHIYLHKDHICSTQYESLL